MHPGVKTGLRPRLIRLVEALAILALLVPVLAQSQPLAHGHAHNDYLHERPLLDALEHGFISVEADVFLIGGELRVAHTIFGARPGRTLERLYLEPLRERVAEQCGGVYSSDLPFTLLIDIKSDADETYLALREVLAGYRDILTTFGPGGHPGAIIVIISGNRPRRLMESETVRYAAFDGRLTDLNSSVPVEFMPLISDRWTSNFRWDGRGEMPRSEREKLHAIVEAAHAQGRRLRFWATPDRDTPARDALWRELLAAGVDLINTDDLEGLQRFLLEQEGIPGHR